MYTKEANIKSIGWGMKEAANMCMVWMGDERFLLEELVCITLPFRECILDF